MAKAKNGPDSAQQPPLRKSLPPFEALRAFDAVARLGGVRKAAQWLERDHAVVSRHLRAIETWLGIPLVERTSAGITLTEDGTSYHAVVARAMDDIAYATLDVLNRGYHDRLHIWSTPGFALHWLSRHLGAFEEAVSTSDIEMRPTDNSPDFASHEADVDIRFFGEYENALDTSSGLRTATIARAPIIAVASLEYLASTPKIDRPRDLLAHQLLHESTFDTWRDWLAAQGVTEDVDLRGPRLWQGHLTLDAAHHGRGVALANPLVAQADLKSGALVNIGKENPAFPECWGEYVLIARRDRWDDPLLRKFRLWLRRVIKTESPEFGPAQKKQS